MTEKTRTLLLHYGGAILLTALAVGIRLLIDPWLGEHLALVTLYGVTALSVWLSGFGPAIVVAILGYLACDWFFIDPRGSISLENPRHFIGLITYLLSCSIIIGFAEAMRIARRNAEASRKQLASEVARSQEAEKRFRFASDAINGIIYEYDYSTNFVYRMQGLSEVLGFAVREVPSTIDWWHQQIHPDDREKHLSIIAKATQERESYLSQFRVIRPDNGNIVWLEERGSILSDEWSKNARIVGIVVDITERKQSEERLRSLNQKLQIVTDSMTAPVTRCSRDLKYLWVSKAYAAWIGRPAEEIVGKPIVEIIGREAFDQLLPHFQQVLSGKEVRYEQRVPFQGAGYRWVNAIYTPTLDTSGSVDGWVAVVLDIHERKQSEELLRSKNERLQLLSIAAETLLHADDADKMLRELFTKIAPHLQLDAYFNFMWDEIGNTLKLASYFGISEGVANSINRIALGEAICGTVAQNRQGIVATCVQQSDDPKAGLAKSLGMRVYACNPLISGQHLLGTLSFASRSRDHFDEDEIEFLRTICHYVTLAYERVRFIEQLRQADRRKDEFLATLAHELRNPLAPIRNAVQIVRMKSPDIPELNWARDIIDRQVAQMARLLDDLLDVSRITRNKLELRKERVPLSGIIEGALETSKPLIDQGEHELIVTLPKEPIYLDADSLRLAQVFANLLNNSAKYTDRGGRIQLRVEQMGDEVIVSVQDTGIGISSEQLPHLFEMFSQVTSALVRSQGGLGIGLSLVKGLVEMHGGTIEAHSDGLGRGSLFIVRLPIPSTVSKVEKEFPSIEKPSRNEYRILVADDNPDAVESLAMMLSLMGHEVRTANDGQQAIEVAEAFRPDIVFLDIGMPRMNGYEACRRIREQFWGKKMLLIALTGWGQDEDKRRSQEVGFDFHMVKPLDRINLQKLLESGSYEKTGSVR